MTNQLTPLWELLFNEDCKEIAACERTAYASMIEALRDYRLPEEPEPAYPPGTEYTLTQAYICWQERQRLRALLTEDARIARAGE